MIQFVNQEFDISKINPNALFVCALGYEERSYYLLDLMKKRLCSENIVAFVFQSYLSKTDKPQRANGKETQGITVIEAIYEECEKFYDKVSELVDQRAEDNPIEIHFDYSYMPRRWYCKLPSLLSEILRPGDNAFFWYSEGSYPDDYTQYPRAGIQSFVPFSGTASLRTESKRTHIIALSYDKVRTEGTLSILDPEAFITCNAYDSSTREIHENVLEINESIISRAILSVSLHMDDFFFMLSKLCELANEFLPIGDVILVPDGPKPLIFAISLVPELLNKPGVTCLHIMRNKREDKPLDVLPNQKVIGFAISKDI